MVGIPPIRSVMAWGWFMALCRILIDDRLARKDFFGFINMDGTSGVPIGSPSHQGFQYSKSWSSMTGMIWSNVGCLIIKLELGKKVSTIAKISPLARQHYPYDLGNLHVLTGTSGWMDFQSSIKSVARAQAAYEQAIHCRQPAMAIHGLPYRKGSTYKWWSFQICVSLLKGQKSAILGQTMHPMATQWDTPNLQSPFHQEKNILKNVSQPRPATCQCFAGQQKLGVQTLQWTCQRFSSQRWPLSVQRGLQKAAGYHSHQIPRFHRF